MIYFCSYQRKESEQRKEFATAAAAAAAAQKDTEMKQFCFQINVFLTFTDFLGTQRLRPSAARTAAHLVIVVASKVTPELSGIALKYNCLFVFDGFGVHFLPWATGAEPPSATCGTQCGRVLRSQRTKLGVLQPAQVARCTTALVRGVPSSPRP